MTDSTADDKSGDGEFDLGPSADELFGDIESDVPEGSSVDRSTTAEDDGIEDRTAADVFDQLRTEADGTADTDELLADESPEDIIESADEPDDEQSVDDDLFDEEAFEDLLLTDRRKEGEFLWVDTGDDPPTDSSEPTADGTAGGTHRSPADESASIDGAPEEADSSAPDDPSDVEPATDFSLASNADSDDLPHGTPPDDPIEVIGGTSAVQGDGADHTDAAVDEGPNTAVGEETDADADEEADADADEETALVPTNDSPPAAGGFFGWLRSKLGGLF